MLQNTIRVVAVDGPSGSGKSSICAATSKKNGWAHISSGVLYRALGHLSNKYKIKIDNTQALPELAKKFVDKLIWDYDNSEIVFEKKKITQFLRSEESGQRASRLSQQKEIRTILLPKLRSIVEESPKLVLMDGRDIGTVVFPDAEVKFYVVADYDVRAKRRLLDFKKLGEEKSIDELIEELKNRDKYDSEREYSPLLKANDAIKVDTTNLTIEEQVDLMFKKVKLKKG